MKLTIGWLYPDLMSTYGDRGNIICLQKRCEWRGIEAKIEEISLNTKYQILNTCNLLFMGGAQDRQQKIAAEDLRKNKGPMIKKLIENGLPALFVCGAYQFMGHYYQPAEGERIMGLGIFDLYTKHPGKEKERCIGNIITEVSAKFYSSNEVRSSRLSVSNSNFLVGFENHGGRTYLGKNVKPLGKVVVGYGNNGDLPASLDGRQVQAGDGTEGCVYNNSIGTYLHGPVLPKNPALADWLIKTALEKKYQEEVELEKIDDNLEWQAHNAILAKFKIKN